jgi:hypothetical protein
MSDVRLAEGTVPAVVDAILASWRATPLLFVTSNPDTLMMLEPDQRVLLKPIETDAPNQAIRDLFGGLREDAMTEGQGPINRFNGKMPINARMTAPPHPRVFSGKPIAARSQRQESISRQATPDELHYASGKLVAWTLLNAVIVLLSIWIVAGGGLGADYHGRDAGIVHLLWP